MRRFYKPVVLKYDSKPCYDSITINRRDSLDIQESRIPGTVDMKYPYG